MADVNTPCDIGELLSAYLDGELRTGELERVDTHLGECENCVLEFRHLKEARAALHMLPVLEPPEWVLDEAFHPGPELSAYLDGELTTAEFPVVTTHLRECAQCRHELHQLDAARIAIRGLPRVEPPALLDVHREAKRSERHRVRRLVTAAAGIAAALVVTLGITSSTPQQDPVDLGSFEDRHIARASVESGFAILPALAPGNVSP
jgi:anti-sigma factor RsiW